MFNLKDIRDREDAFLFYKVIEKQYVKSLTEQGEIYFGLLEKYREMEQQNMKEVGDRREASLTTLVREYINIDGKYCEIHGPNAGYNIRINANQCAFCCYYAGLKNFTQLGENRYQLVLSASDIATICADKGGEENCAIAIFDSKVIHKIYDVLKNRHFPYAGQKVTYDDYAYRPKHDIHSPEYAIECTFHKSKKYAYQKEFRIAALNYERAPISDLFIHVDDKDFDVIELKKGHNLKCNIEFDAQNVDERKVAVHFKIRLSLEEELSHET